MANDEPEIRYIKSVIDMFFMNKRAFDRGRQETLLESKGEEFNNMMKMNNRKEDVTCLDKLKEKFCEINEGNCNFCPCGLPRTLEGGHCICTRLESAVNEECVVNPNFYNK